MQVNCRHNNATIDIGTICVMTKHASSFFEYLSFKSTLQRKNITKNNIHLRARFLKSSIFVDKNAEKNMFLNEKVLVWTRPNKNKTSLWSTVQHCQLSPKIFLDVHHTKQSQYSIIKQKIQLKALYLSPFTLGVSSSLSESSSSVLITSLRLLFLASVLRIFTRTLCWSVGNMLLTSSNLNTYYIFNHTKFRE